jgi:hypothetical protein
MSLIANPDDHDNPHSFHKFGDPENLEHLEKLTFHTTPQI